MDIHPVAALFPMLGDDELAELAADIKERGLLHPIVLDGEGRVLDGRNRHAACERAGIEPRFETYDGDDPAGYALAVNGQRRSLTKTQKALVAAEVLLSSDSSNGSEARTARALGVARQLVNQAVLITRFAGERRAHIMLTGSGFAEARELAAQRKAEADRLKAKMDELAVEASDLRALVDEGRMSVDEGIAALRAREDKARRETEAARIEAERKAEAARRDAEARANEAERLARDEAAKERAHAIRVSNDVRRLLTLAQSFGSDELRRQMIEAYDDQLGDAPKLPSGRVSAKTIRAAGKAMLALATEWEKLR